MQITTAPAQVGNGRTVHRVRTDGFHSKTLCGRTADRCLGESDLKKMRGSCIRCSERLGELLADQPEAVAEAPVEEPTHYTVECAIVQAHPGYREQDTPEEDAEEEPEAADSPEADATVTALPFHGPDGYTGPRAVCSYDDHTAPAREDGTVEDHERTAGLMGSCPGSLLAARESSDQPTRWYTAALSYEHPRESWLVTGAKPGDVVRYDLEEMTVEDLQVDEDDPSTVYLHLDWVNGPVRFTVGERLRFTRRVRRQDARCQECGVYAVLESDTATDGVIRARICGFCDGILTAEDAAREAATRMHPSAHEFRPFHRDGEEQPAGWTFRIGYAALARYAVVTAAAELPAGLYEYATTAERAFLQAEREAAAVQS